MDVRTKLAVASMTLPLLLRYHYPLRPTFEAAGGPGR